MTTTTADTPTPRTVYDQAAFWFGAPLDKSQSGFVDYAKDIESRLTTVLSDNARLRDVEKAAREYFTASQIVMTTDQHTEAEHFNAIIARDALRTALKALKPPTEPTKP